MISSWLRQDRRGRADLFRTAGFVAPCMTLLTTLRNLLFRVFFGDCQREESSRATLPVTLLTTLKNLLFRVSLGIDSGKRVEEQPPR